MFSNRVKEPEPARNLLRLPRLVVLLPSLGIYLFFLSIYQYIYLFRSGVIVKGGHCQPVTGGYDGAFGGDPVTGFPLPAYYLSIYPSRIEVMMTCSQDQGGQPVPGGYGGMLSCHSVYIYLSL